MKNNTNVWIAVVATLVAFIIPFACFVATTSASISGTSLEAIGLVEVAGETNAEWKISDVDTANNKMTITGTVTGKGFSSLQGSTSDTKGSLVVTLPDNVDAGVLEYSYSYELSAGNGRKVAGTASLTVNGTLIASATGTNGISGSKENNDSVAKTQITWSDSSQLTFSLVAKGAQQTTGGKNSTAKVTITLQYTAYKKDSVTFAPSSTTAYSILYFADADAATAGTSSTVSVAKNATEKVSVSGELSSGMAIKTTTGYHCIGASYTHTVDGVTSSGYLELNSEGRIVPLAGYVITPDFVYDTNGIAPFQVNEKKYWTWETAISAAKSSGTVIVTDSYTLPTTYADNYMSKAGSYVTDNNGALIYTVPSGVKFLMPYQAGATTIASGDASKDFPYANFSTIVPTVSNVTTNSQLSPTNNVSYTLTVPGGIKIVNNGTFVIGGVISSGEGVAGGTTGAHSNLYLSKNSVLEMGSNSILSVCGYVLGDGEIIAKSSASIYQLFTIPDYRSGNYVVGTAGPMVDAGLIGGMAGLAGMELGIRNDYWESVTGEDAVSPFVRYSLRGIQTKITINNQATIYGYCDLYTHSTTTHNKCTFPVAGASGMLKLTTSNSLLIATYDASQVTATGDYIGRNMLQIIGGADFESTTMPLSFKFPVIGDVNVSINTNELIFPIPHNFAITLDKGDYNIKYSLRFLPGSELVVEKDAVLNVTNGSKMIIYDQMLENIDYEKDNVITVSSLVSGGMFPYPSGINFYASGNKSANFVVNGEFNVLTGTTFAGLIQTNPDEDCIPKVSIATGATVTTKVRNGVAGYYSFNGNIHLAAATVHTVEAKLYNINSGIIENVVAGTIYYGAADTKSKNSWYFYDFYGNSNYSSSSTPVPNITGTKTMLSGNYLGSWYTLPVHSTTDRTDGMKIDAEYRLQDYLWLNAICYLDKSYTGVTQDNVSVSLEGAQIVVATASDGTPAIYIVKKIPSDQIADTITFTISYNGLISAPITISIDDCKDGTTETDQLVEALKTYGQASKKYFVTGGTPASSLTKPNMTGCTVFGKKIDASGSYNGVTLITKGANVLFEERISMMLGFQLSDTLTEDDVVQVGVLIGSVGGGELTTSLENVTKAYILYGKSNDGVASDNKPTLPNYDNFEIDTKETVSWKDLNADGRMVLYMDLKSEDYISTFEFRPFVITKGGTVLYGAQYAYSLADYINNMLAMSDTDLKKVIDPKDATAFRNLLIATWDYALKAEAKFGTK